MTLNDPSWAQLVVAWNELPLNWDKLWGKPKQSV